MKSKPMLNHLAQTRPGAHSNGNNNSAEVKFPSTESVFHVHNVSMIYRMGEIEVHSLRDVTADLLPGRIRRAAGSGKSTLLNILGGLDRPSRRATPRSPSQRSRSRALQGKGCRSRSQAGRIRMNCGAGR
jgi:ABC-type glutathione transport system ATPase component